MGKARGKQLIAMMHHRLLAHYTGQPQLFYEQFASHSCKLHQSSGSDIFPIEIKAGMTITRDYFKGLNHFAKVFPDQMHSGSGMVYGGVEAQRRTGVLIAPYSNLNMLFDSANDPG